LRRCDTRKALLMLESMVVSGKLDEPPLTPWEGICRELAGKLFKGPHTPRTLLELRSLFYTLITANIAPATIIRKVTEELVAQAAKLVQGAMLAGFRGQLWQIAAVYDSFSFRLHHSRNAYHAVFDLVRKSGSTPRH